MASKSSKEQRGSDVDAIRKQLQEGNNSSTPSGSRYYYGYQESGLNTRIRPLAENDDYEVYFLGKSTNGALLNGSKSDYSISTFEKYTKYDHNSKKLQVPKGQSLKFIDIGLQFSVVMTTRNEVYLFGDFVYGSTSNEINPLGRKLKVLMTLEPEAKVGYFPDDPISMLCGEQYAAVLDCCNRLWYCGIEKFGTGGYNCTYDFVEIGLKEFLANEFVDEPAIITHIRVGGRHLCMCINNKTLISVGANYYGQLGVVSVPEIATEGTVAKTIAKYPIIKSNWNSNGKYKVRDITCSGNMTAIITECGKLFKTTNQAQQGSESLVKIDHAGYSLKNISGNWTHILAHTSTNQIMGITDTNSTEVFKELALKDCNLFISTGTNSNNTYYTYSENELYNSENTSVLKTSLPIAVCKVTSEATMVLCMNFKSNKNILAMKKNLLYCTISQGLSDIQIHTQQ